MGVPGFFLWLMKNYKKDGFVFQKDNINNNDVKKEIDSIDYFLIDANCLIHPVCFKTVASNPELTDISNLENKMINAVIEYLEWLIKYVNPQKGIYIAVDGVAPMAKIKQQRTRRFKSIADKNLWDNIKKKHSRPIGNYWNNNAVTPGTEFMEKLHNKILSWAKTLDRHVIYSSCFTPGEGEHKLLQFIRDQSDNSLSYVIYGLDADLIFLALSTESNNIYLLREANEINKKDSVEILNYISIRIMRTCISDTIKKYLLKKDNEIINDTFYGFTNLDTIKIVNDFIFMCYLLGNDFLPHIPSLDIHHNGIEALIISYSEVIRELLLERNSIEYLLDDKKKVNTDFLARFIKRVAGQEEITLKDNFIRNKKRMKCDGDLYEKEVFKIENLQFRILDPIQLGSDSNDLWRLRYYKYYWNIDDDELEEFSEKVVKHYLIGIKWVTEYYFKKCPSWEWYYPFDYPPFISDIAKYIDKININKVKFDRGKPVKPFVQLLTVLPPQSNLLLPNVLRKLVTNPKSSIIFMYPTEFEQDFINKKKYWMGVPRLPPLDIELIKHSYYKYKDEILTDEKKRNITTAPYYFNDINK